MITCITTRPHFCNSSLVAVATDAAIAGGGEVLTQEHASCNCKCAWRTSLLNWAYSHWNTRECCGVVAAYNNSSIKK